VRSILSYAGRLEAIEAELRPYRITSSLWFEHLSEAGWEGG
jgi:hypothetical protein